MTGHETFFLGLLATVPAILSGAAGLLYALAKIHEVHKIVNAQRDQMIAEIAVLRKIIEDRRVDDMRLESRRHD